MPPSLFLGSHVSGSRTILALILANVAGLLIASGAIGLWIDHSYFYDKLSVLLGGLAFEILAAAIMRRRRRWS
jgi:hypothetical protein